MRRALVAVIVAVAVFAALVVVLKGTKSEPRLAGTNGTDAGSFSIEIRDRGEHCQAGQFVPAGADRAQLTIGAYDRPTPPVELTIKTADGREVVRHTTPGGFPQGVATLALGQTTKEPLANATVCIRTEGSKLALGGFQDRARVAYLRPGSESYLGLTGTIVHRFAQGKPGWQGGWLLVLALIGIVAVWLIVARLILREAGHA